MLSAKKELFTPSGGAYQISRSVRLRNSATGYFSRTIGATATNAKIGTLSMWVKRGGLTSATGNSQYLIQTGISATTDSGHFTMYFTTSDNLSLGQYSWAGYSTTQVFRDPSAWYHIVLSYNSTLASNNLTIYVNGVQIAVTSVVQNTNWAILSGTEAINIGRHTSVGRSFDGYLTEINLIDGQALTPSSFGETNPITGVWQPKRYAGTYGTNGFYLNFSDNSGVTATTIGKDYSGNGNNWTPSAGISITAGVTYDSMLDVPTQWADGGNGRGNYAVLNPIGVPFANGTITDGNLKFAGLTTTDKGVAATISISSGAFYWESTQLTNSGSSNCYAGVILTGASSDVNANRVYVRGDGLVLKYGTSLGTVFSTFTNNDVIGFAFDRANNTLAIYKNGTLGYTVTGLNNADHTPWVGGYTTTDTWAVNFGQRPFAYTPPTGFKALNTQNLPTPTISNGANYMAATTYTGTGSSLTIANTVGSASFQPDLVWVKGRSGATDHALYDAVRGVQKQLESNSTGAETTETTGLTAFGSTGFTVGALAQMNTSAATYVGWQWNAGGSTVTNTSGTISSQVRANTTAGFSVVTYTGTGAAATVGHGLGVTPDMVIIKSRSLAGENWIVYHISLGNAQQLNLNTTAAQAASTNFNSTSPTSSVFSIGSGTAVNSNTNTYVAYCFDAVAGYSAFGSYTGNASTDGPFTYLGFEPRWVMIKRTDTTGDWQMYDTSRAPINLASNTLYANGAFAEDSNTTNRALDLLSNGFKLRSSASFLNASGGTYIYAAFAENPFKLSLAR